MPESGAAAMLDATLEATRCHDVWPLLEAWARAEREMEAVNLAQCAPYTCQAAEVELKARSNAARKQHETATAALLGAVPEPGGE